MFPIAQYEIHENTIPFRTTVGSFTKNGSCFAAAASAKRFYVFDPVEQPDESKTFIKVGQKITCIIPCPYQNHDCLAVGTDNSLQLFDIDENSQVFTALISDGVNSLSLFGNHIYVGSNCAILGYDMAGNEVFWTVTGDVVTAICEIEWDGEKCILAASNDLMIRLFSGEESKRERKVHAPVSYLVPMGPNQYVVSFETGSVSLIKGLDKIWDISIPGQVVGLQALDFTGSGHKDLAVATGEGIIQILDSKTGQAKISDDTRLHIAGMHLIDFKKDNHACLAVIGTTGSIRIFMPKLVDGLGAEAKREYDLKQAQPTLIKEKARLLLRQYELSRELSGETTYIAGSHQTVGPPKNLNVNYKLGQRLDIGCAELQLKSVPPLPIHGAIVECPTTSGGNFVVFEVNEPAEPTQKVLLNFSDDATTEMKVDVFVSGVCFSFKCPHKKFFGFELIKNDNKLTTKGYAEFAANGDAFQNFITKSFVLQQDLPTHFKCTFKSLEFQEPLILSSDGARCKIECQKVATASRIINEYCDVVNLETFECRAHFPEEIDELMNAVREGGEMNDTQQIQRTEVAGLIAQLKDIIVKIENADEIGLYPTMHESIGECERLNAEIAREHIKRITNKDVLGTGNQKVNSLVQKFAELRKGSSRNMLLQMCRKELQTRDFKKLAYLLEYGHEIMSQQ